MIRLIWPFSKQSSTRVFFIFRVVTVKSFVHGDE